jgi:osmoprotectant transport system substrate-binding protein
VVIGSAGFTEIQLIAEMYKLLLDKAGYSPTIKVVQNREVYEPALEKGDIGVVPDYAATMTEFLNVKANGPDVKPVATSDKHETVAALNKLGEPLGIKALQAADAVDQNAFAVTKDYATKNNVTKTSDLQGKSVVVAATEECPDRPFCQPGLEKTYGIKVTKILPLGFGTAQVKDAVKSGKAQLGLVGTTDATLSGLGLVILDDDKGLQLADNLVPVVGKDFLDDTKLADALNALAGTLTTDDLAQLDKKVDGERLKAADVAKEYLTSKSLL